MMRLSSGEDHNDLSLICLVPIAACGKSTRQADGVNAIYLSIFRYCTKPRSWELSYI